MLVLTLHLIENCLLLAVVYAKLADWRAFSSLWFPSCSGSTRVIGHNVWFTWFLGSTLRS